MVESSIRVRRNPVLCEVNGWKSGEKLSDTISRNLKWFILPWNYRGIMEKVYGAIKEIGDPIATLRKNDENYPLGAIIEECLDISDEKQNVKRVRVLPEVSYQLDEQIREIDKELASCLPKDLERLAVKTSAFYATYFKFLLDDEPLKIIEYFEGTRTVDEIGIKRENAARFLMITKIIDLVFMRQILFSGKRIVFKNSSYGLRTHLLKLLSPDIRTADVYTYSLDPCKLKNVDYLLKPNNWVPERIDFYKKMVVPQYLSQMNALSKRLHDDGKTIYFIKGGTASGKSTFAKQRFKDGLDKDGELTGCMNPDNMKFILKTSTCDNHIVTNLQVHDEAVRGPLSTYYDDLLAKADYSIIIDRPIPLYEDFEKLLDIAKKKGNKIEVIELHAPLNVMLRRVLQRDPKGKDPCVMPAEIRKSFIESIRSRGSIIKRLQKEKIVKAYQLYYTNNKGELGLVAEKHEDAFQVHSKEYFKKCLKLPSEAKIQAKMNDANYQNDGIPLCKAIEYKALGMTHSEAIVQHKKETELNRLYGAVVTQPFTGDWLRKFPKVLEHIDSEQLRHIRGVDGKGRGLHWQTNKFAWKLNPQFNPEARFQMRVGYFIVPPSHADILSAKNLSQSVLKELEVKSESGELIGYRFFVHPESYAHFQSLHEAGIPFVKSENSEFIGTPTSSYRSWIVRHITKDPKDDTIPFIVKLGVMQLNDTNRLLTDAEVKKSVSKQMIFEKITPNPKLRMFPETFGLSLKGIANYPPLNSICNNSSVDSGMIIREIPKDLIEGKCRILSFSALMSVEGMLNPVNGIESSLDSPLPLIFEIMNKAIEKGTVKSAFEFIQRYLISDIFEAVEDLLKDSFSLPLHGQNLCLVLDSDDLPLGIAIRDFGDIDRDHRYLESYSWFYRYHVFCKLLNVLVDTQSYNLPPIDGAPVQIGNPIPLTERNVNYYLRKNSSKMANRDSYEKVLKNVSITFEEYQKLLKILDSSFLSLLSRIFDMDKIAPFVKDGIFPSAEMGSSQDVVMKKFNRILFPHSENISGLDDFE